MRIEINEQLHMQGKSQQWMDDWYGSPSCDSYLFDYHVLYFDDHGHDSEECHYPYQQYQEWLHPCTQHDH